MKRESIVGVSVPRKEGFDKVTGRAQYIDDMSLPDMLFGATGFFVDRFAATQSEGVVWLHGYGNVFEKVLAPGEQIDVEPGSWIYRD